MAKKQPKAPTTLQEWMEREGVSGVELARRAKMTPSYVSMVLRGSRRCSWKKAVVLHSLTGVPVENIMQWPKVPVKRSYLEVA